MNLIKSVQNLSLSKLNIFLSILLFAVCSLLFVHVNPVKADVDCTGMNEIKWQRSDQ